MYRVVRDCIKAKLTSMAGPVWGAALAGVRTASEEVQHRALYRMPKVYQMSVQVVLFTTLLVDASIGGAVVGRLWHGPTGARPWWQAGPSPETQSDAVLDVESSSAAAVLMASIATTALLAVLFVPATLLLAVCVELEEPFGDQTMDLPGLSCAHICLRACACACARAGAHGRATLAMHPCGPPPMPRQSAIRTARRTPLCIPTHPTPPAFARAR